MESKQLIYVLGLGPTLNNFTPNGTPTIGVNDINVKLQQLNKKHVVNNLVLQDNPPNFEYNRYLDIINNPPTDKVYSQHNVYRDIISCPFEHLRLVPYAYSIFDVPITKFNQWEVPSSIDSTFLACVVAARLGYKNIVTFGADFGSHPNLSQQLGVILTNYDLLKNKLNNHGINLYCSSMQSKLSQVLPIKHLTP